MSQNKQSKRTSLRQSRQNMKLERIIKFIQNNNPVNIKTISSTQMNSPNETVIKNEHQKQYSQQFGKSSVKNSKKNIITQAINLYIDKRSQYNNRYGSTLDHVQKRQIKLKTGQVIKSEYSIKEESALPLIRAVKTQQASGSLKRSREKQIQIGRVLLNKKYDSLLLVPKLMMIEKQKKQLKNPISREKSFSNRKQHVGEIKRVEKSSSRSGQKYHKQNWQIKDYGCTGWETSYQFKEMEHINYAHWN